ncbi:MAG: hypothetical protein OES09_12260, partial [Gammaproteobacteria bacterium]|nr:hypothetical protein [Gammaproteobacteria bacterium]
MTRTLWWVAVRDFIGHPWQAALSVTGIALGVAAVLSIDIVNHSAERAFTWANQTVAGHASDTIVGGPSGLDERIYRKL